MKDCSILAFARVNCVAYGKPDAAELAAAWRPIPATNHPFVDLQQAYRCSSPRFFPVLNGHKLVMTTPIACACSPSPPER